MSQTVVKPVGQTIPETHTKNVMMAALVTGQIAALIMAVAIMVVFTVFLGKGPLYPVQVIGSTIYGEAALQGFNVSAFIAGLILHLAVAFAWSIPFAFLVYIFNIRSPLLSMLTGIVVAVVSMIDTYLFVPAVMNTLQGVDIWNREVPITWNWIAHLVFGASFVLFPKVLHTLDKHA